MTLPACNCLNFESSNLNSSNQKMKSIGYFERSSTFFALGVETHVRFIRSILEDSLILSFFFRFSLRMLCLCCKVRDLYTLCCVKKQNTSNSSALVFWLMTRTQHKKRVPIVAEEMSQVLFSIVTGIK